MRRFTAFIIIIVFFIIPLVADEKEIVERASQHVENKDYAKALQVLDEGIKELGLTKNLLRLKYILLVRMGKLDDALAILDKGLKTIGESPDLLMQKLFLLMKQGKYREALKTALRKEEIIKQKNPYDCMDIVEVYVRLNNIDKAFEWLDKAVDRGFTMIKSLEKDLFKPLTRDARFEKIRAKIKDNLGLDKTARDFIVKLYPEGTFQLSKQVGKVVLIDFWATWCGPCRKEMPNLKQYYKDFKARGFEIIGISLDRQEESLKKYLETEKLPWKISYSGLFWDDKTAKLYGINAIPSYWIVDRKGILRYSGLRGPELKKAIAELIAE